METNLDVESGPLADKAARLLEAAMDYWEAYKKATGGAAVVWVKDTDGRMVILTRGEYQEQLFENIDRLKWQRQVPLRAFDD